MMHLALLCAAPALLVAPVAAPSAAMAAARAPVVAVAAFAPAAPSPAAAGAAVAPAGEDVVVDALVAELQRAQTLKLQDLESPYFVQLTLTETQAANITASYGALYGSGMSRSRRAAASVRVGAADLDNTHFTGDGGFDSFTMEGQRPLQLEDDTLSIRHAAWLAADAAYKSAVETLTKKRAYLKDKTIADRPADFSAAEPVQHVDPLPAFSFDRPAWEARLVHLSEHLRSAVRMQDSSVTLQGGATTRWLVNSEGTRLRTASESWTLTVNAQAQAADGMRFSDELVYTTRAPDALPPDSTILADIDALVARLTAAMDAPTIDNYSGPVLFEDVAAAQVVRAFLGDKLAAKPESVGQQRNETADDLQKKLGQVILPRGFDVTDQPVAESAGGRPLAGHYVFDDEGVRAANVELIKDGKLAALLLSRSPTKKLSGSNGHGRQAAFFGQPEASIANVFLHCSDGKPEASMRQMLVDRIKEAGLEQGLVVTRLKKGSENGFMSFFMGGGGGGKIEIPDPLYAFLVKADGSVAPVRGVEFGPASLRTLKDIAAAGDGQFVDSDASSGPFGGGGSAVVSPSLLFEDLDLTQIEQELDKLPILPRPADRAP